MTVYSLPQSLHFHSGFEPAATVNIVNDNVDIYGTDTTVSAPNNWGIGGLQDTGLFGNFNGLMSAGVEPDDRDYAIIDDPTGAKRGKVLKTEITNHDGSKGRIQNSLYGNSASLTEMTQSLGMYIGSDIQALEGEAGEITWGLTLWEGWTGVDFGNPPNFTMTVRLVKASGAGEPLTWRYWSHDDNGGSIQTYENVISTEAVRYDEWFTVTIHYLRGTATTGRFQLGIHYGNGSKVDVFDLTTPTESPDTPAQQTGLTDFNPIKMYGPNTTFNTINAAGGPATIYWDNFNLYVGDAYNKLMGREKGGASLSLAAMRMREQEQLLAMLRYDDSVLLELFEQAAQRRTQ